jgi:ABC-type lipoprotein release transport system permease subunit
MPLPFTVSPLASALWLALVLAGALMASYLPARRAAALPVRVALAHT